MNLVTVQAFTDEFQKISGIAGFVARHGSNLTHGAELGGLGVLAVPSAAKLRKSNPASEEEKRHAKYELAGLGVLGVPSAIGLAHHAFKKMKRAGAFSGAGAGAAVRAGRAMMGTPRAGALGDAFRAAQQKVLPHPPVRLQKDPQRAAMLAAFTPKSNVVPKRTIELPRATEPFIIER
jgi:hypothetical protein